MMFVALIPVGIFPVTRINKREGPNRNISMQHRHKIHLEAWNSDKSSVFSAKPLFVQNRNMGAPKFQVHLTYNYDFYVVHTIANESNEINLDSLNFW